jgi:DNA-binding XRE family transcriptional regulator
MKLSDYRESRGLTQPEMAEALGLSAKSKGLICQIETGAKPASLKLALKIEHWSGGQVPAGSLCPLVADLRAGARAA